MLPTNPYVSRFNSLPSIGSPSGHEDDDYAVTVAPPTQINHKMDFYSLNTEGQRFNYKDRTYKIVIKNERFAATELTTGETGWRKFFGVSGKNSREAHINKFLLDPTNRHFRIDMDKTLVIRQDLAKHPNTNGYPRGINPNDREKFDKTTLWRKDKPVEVLVDKNLLGFLTVQHELGAKVSICSSGGWQDYVPMGEKPQSRWQALKRLLGFGPLRVELHVESPETMTIRAYLSRNRITMHEFDNKKSLDKKLNPLFILVGARSVAGLAGGWHEKFFAVGNTNEDGSSNILFDDQRHQRRLFAHSVTFRAGS